MHCDNKFKKQPKRVVSEKTELKRHKSSQMTLHFDCDIMVKVNDYLQENEMFFAELLKQAVIEFISE